MKILALLFSLFIVSTVTADERADFLAKVNHWKQWLSVSLSSCSGNVEQVNLKIHERFSQNSDCEFVRTFDDGAGTLRAELFNRDYRASLVSRSKERWLIESFTPAGTERYDMLTTFGSDYFHSHYGMCIHYFLVSDVLSEVERNNAGSYEVSLSAEKYPTNIIFQQRPDKAVIQFGHEGLPTEVRFHFTHGNLNYALVSKYANVDGIVRVSEVRDFIAFPKLDSRLEGFLNDSLQYKNVHTEKMNPAIFRLPHYGLPEPKLHDQRFSRYAFWCAILLSMLGLAYAIRRIKS